jgi:alpha-L-fucosidase
MIRTRWVSLVLFAAMMTSTLMAADQYEQTWESLSKHPIPEWFQDAKFGIYAHLGVYCVPAYNSEWYPRNMYERSDNPNSVFQYHIRTHGDQSEFGYKDFIPMFKLEKFDPAEWAELYAQAGAKFAGPVAEHHDGFSMWASKVNRWNAAAMGPERDVVGELVNEIRKRDMKVVTSFHHAHNFQGYYPNVPGTDLSDPEYADLYGKLGREASRERWLAKLKEVIDAYQPDQIWFDFGLQRIPDSYKQEFAAYYYNKEADWGKPVIITRKGDHLPEGVGVLDIERGRMSGMGQTLWQTDDSTAHNSWSWVQGLRVKPPQEVLHVLIDIVSKNGVLMLNVCPSADGTISDDQKKILLEMGQWLKVNGEAIYATRPWELYGEGPTRMGGGGGFARTVQYGSEDIRFTRSKDGKTLYAITLGWPTGPFAIRSVSVKNAPDNAKVEMLGHGQSLPFTVNDDKSLTLTPPALTVEQLPCQYAYAFKLTGFELEANQSLPSAGRR